MENILIQLGSFPLWPLGLKTISILTIDFAQCNAVSNKIPPDLNSINLFFFWIRQKVEMSKVKIIVFCVCEGLLCCLNVGIRSCLWGPTHITVTLDTVVYYMYGYFISSFTSFKVTWQHTSLDADWEKKRFCVLNVEALYCIPTFFL